MPGDPSKSLSPEDILVGGQAVIEGVMMRTPYAYAVAVRRADGSLEVKKEGVRRLSQMWKPLSWPVLRGGATLIQSMALGVKALNFSAKVFEEDLNAQAELEKEHVEIPTGSVSSGEKQLIAKNGILNDVAACFFIKGQAAEKRHHAPSKPPCP